MLPDGDGVSLARRLREADDDLELIMATGMRRFDVAVEGMRLNVMDYLLTPFTRQQLVDTVDRAVRRREATRHERTDRAQFDAQIAPRAEEISRSLNKAAQEATLDALLRALHTRNPDAATHAYRVARMAVTLGMQLGLPESELAVLEYGALLHDIGKIAVPDALMCRPGPLCQGRARGDPHPPGSGPHHHFGGAVARALGRHRPRVARGVGRQRLSPRPVGHGDSHRRAHHRGDRHLRRADLVARLP